jgi:uncharacterized protein (DUF2164 family)
MPLDQKAIIAQIDDVLAKSANVAGAAEVSRAFNVLLSAVQRLAPPGSVYAKNLKGYEATQTSGIIEMSRKLEPIRGMLEALRSDYESGYQQSVVELIHADIFTDFLEMSDYLLQQGYKDAAAVIIGSVLEAHLRKLCDKHSIPVLKPDGTHQKAESLNTELSAAGVYNMLDQKSVTAWLDLRNKAAHGKYADYVKDQVASMLENVRNFVSRVPA